MPRNTAAKKISAAVVTAPITGLTRRPARRATQPAVNAAHEADEPLGVKVPANARSTASGSAAVSRPRPSSKISIVLEILEAAEGASLARLIEVTGWLPHTTRAALTGLRKRGFDVVSIKGDGASGKVSLYRILHAEAA